jgi:hypothetical protein
VALDYVPNAGTVIRVNGNAKGEPIPGEAFYHALLRIWLGENVPATDLRQAMLGK